MSRIEELESQVLALPDGARAVLASRLLESLPHVYSDDDDGVAEALRRDREMDEDESASVSLDELRRAVDR